MGIPNLKPDMLRSIEIRNTASVINLAGKSEMYPEYLITFENLASGNPVAQVSLPYPHRQASL